MKLTAYQVMDNAPEIRPGHHQREWMDETPQGYAYFCLPLIAASRSGWELLNPSTFTAVWNGSPDAAGLHIVEHESGGSPTFVKSHFGSGILTFTTGYLFRTDEGCGLLVKGAPNQFKDGIAPLEGVVETDWLPYTFTMNWKFTRPNHPVTFAAGESFCFIMLAPRMSTDDVETSLEPITANQELYQQYKSWMTERYRFDKARLEPDSIEAKQKWRKDYLKGKIISGEKQVQHQRSPVLTEFGKSLPHVYSSEAMPESAESCPYVSDLKS